MRKLFGIAALASMLLATAPIMAADFMSQVKLIDPPQPVPALVFEDADKQQHTLADYRGKFVLLNVWATWCAPCVKEMPSLEALARLFDPRKFAVLPLSEDRADSAATAFYHTHALTHLPIAVDAAGIAPSALRLHGLPTSILIDPQGREVAIIEGDADWAAPDAVAFLRHKIANN